MGLAAPFLFAAAALAAPVGEAQPCTASLCQAKELAPYFRKLVDRKPVHILQIGDSHTAGDALTGAWRTLLQAQYGSGGRGVLPPGHPYRGFVAQGVQVSTTGNWQSNATLGPTSLMPRPPIGLSSYSLTSQGEGASISLAAEAGQAFDRFVLCALAQPGAGKLTLRVGFRIEELDLSSFAVRPECKSVETPEAQLTAQVTVTGGPVTITSWGTFRSTGGVTLSNVGVVGSQFAHFGRTDDAVVAEELRAYRPDLIVIAFGTNEGFAPRIDPAGYEIVLRTQIARMRRLAGNVPMLMLGVPDAATRNAALNANAPGAAIDCNVRPQTIDDIMAALKASEAAGEGAQTPVEPEADPVRRPLFIPPGMAVVRDVQRKVAASLDIAFWDWQSRMGGACAATRFVTATPPLMRGDFVHFNTAGGWEIAKLLQADLAAAARTMAGRN